MLRRVVGAPPTARPTSNPQESRYTRRAPPQPGFKPRCFGLAALVNLGEDFVETLAKKMGSNRYFINWGRTEILAGHQKGGSTPILRGYRRSPVPAGDSQAVAAVVSHWTYRQATSLSDLSRPEGRSYEELQERRSRRNLPVLVNLGEDLVEAFQVFELAHADPRPVRIRLVGTTDDDLVFGHLLLKLRGIPADVGVYKIGL